MRDHPLVYQFIKSVSQLVPEQSIVTCSIESEAIALAREAGETLTISRHWKPFYYAPNGRNFVFPEYDFVSTKDNQKNLTSDPFSAKASLPEKADWLFAESYLTEGMLKAVKDDGILLLSTSRGIHEYPAVAALLKVTGFHICGYVNITTEDSRARRWRTVQTRSGVVLAVLSKRETNCLLFTVDSAFDAAVVAEQLSRLRDGAEIEANLEVNRFVNFHHHLVLDEISKIKSRYKEFESRSLDDIAENVNDPPIVGEKANNAVYFPKFGVHPPADSIGALQEYTLERGKPRRLKDLNLGLQVVLKSEMLAEYVTVFFRSELGSLLLDACVSNKPGPEVLDFDLLMQAEIPIPNLPTQKRIVEADNSLNRLKHQLEEVQGSLASNPLSNETYDKIQEMLVAADAMTSIDDVRAIIRAGESKSVEFKQTFQYCLRSKQATDAVERSALKSIVGFMNANGGCLLIGVADDGAVTGIGTELEKFHRKRGNPEDSFVLKLKDKIKRRIGESALTDLDINIIEIDEQQICKVDCFAATEGVYLDEEHFFLRVPAATEEMKGKSLEKYIKQRFS